MTDSRVSLIAAVADNGVIGVAGEMPWRLSTDLRRFKLLTMGKPIVMGRKTFESIGKPLAGRVNIVVTRQPDFAAEGVVVASSLPVALEAAQTNGGESGEVMVIGGGEVYAAAIGAADRLYITHVSVSPDGDTHFPPIDSAVWRARSREPVPAGEKDSAASTFVVYDRVGRDPSG